MISIPLRRRSWSRSSSYRRRQTGRSGSNNDDISSSSASGTIVSSTTTNTTSSASHLYSVEDLDAIFSCEKTTEEDTAAFSLPLVREKVKQMVHEYFFAAPLPSANCSGDMRVLERWFTELGVAWVLHLTEDGASASARRELDHHDGFDDDNDARSWIRGLAEIMKTINHTWSSFSEDGASVGLPGIHEEEPETESGGNKDTILDLFQFAQFIQVAMAKMLAFVDIMVASSATNNTTTQVLLTTDSGLVLPCEKISTLLGVHGALRRVNIRLSELASPSAKVETIKAQIINLLSSKDGKTGEAIRSIVEQIWTELTEDSCDWSSSLTPQGSSDIHEATRSIMRYINVLRSHRSSMALIIPTEANRPQIGDMPLFDSMMAEIASCLEEKLASRSESFPDQSLRSLFLLNNAYFIRRQLSNRVHPPKVRVAGLNHKINDYFRSYLQISWEPVLSCLLNPNQLLFGENYTHLFMFESEFQKTCTAQKQWKVPDRKVRKNMRRAIVWKIVPDYAKYIEQNKVTTPKFSPGELEEMLQELFEE